MQKAIDILKNFSSGVFFDEYYDPHITIQCTVLCTIRKCGPRTDSADLCCYNALDFVKMIDILSAVKWEPITVSYGTISCNQNSSSGSQFHTKASSQFQSITPAPAHISIIIPLDEPSQQKMYTFVGQLEATLEANGMQFSDSVLIVRLYGNDISQKSPSPFYSQSLL